MAVQITELTFLQLLASRFNLPTPEYLTAEATGAQIGKHIEEFEVATPQTFARYTGSYNGIIYGYEPEPWDSLMPRLMSLKDDQHFEGLQFCGGFAFRCHGCSSSVK